MTPRQAESTTPRRPGRQRFEDVGDALETLGVCDRRTAEFVYDPGGGVSRLALTNLRPEETGVQKKPGKSTGWTPRRASAAPRKLAYISAPHELAPPPPAVRPRTPVQRAPGARHGHQDRRFDLCQTRRADAHRQRRRIRGPVVRRLSRRRPARTCARRRGHRRRRASSATTCAAPPTSCSAWAPAAKAPWTSCCRASPSAERLAAAARYGRELSARARAAALRSWSPAPTRHFRSGLASRLSAGRCAPPGVGAVRRHRDPAAAPAVVRRRPRRAAGGDARGVPRLAHHRGRPSRGLSRCRDAFRPRRRLLEARAARPRRARCRSRTIPRPSS